MEIFNWTVETPHDSAESLSKTVSVILTPTCDGVCVSFSEIYISGYQQIQVYQMESCRIFRLEIRTEYRWDERTKQFSKCDTYTI